MSNKITIKRSAVTGKVPEPSDLDYGEFALNYTDGNLFFKSNANVITNLASTQFVSVTGNVTGNYFIGNGSQLTGVTAVAAPAGNTNEVQINGGGVTSASANFTFDGTNVSVLGNITGNYFIGNGSGLSAITGSNVTGQVGNALVSGTVYTAAQPNITSVGTLSELTVAGNVQANGTIGIGTVPGIPALSANGKMLVGDSITNANIGNVVNYANSTGTAAYRPINLVDTSAVIKIARLDNGTNGPSIELQQWDTDISTLASRWDLYTTTAGLAIRKLTSPASDAIVVDNDARVLIGSNASINTTSANLMANVANLNLQVLGSAYVSANVGIGTANISAPLTVAFTSGTPIANLMTTDAAIITANATAPGFAFVVAGASSGHRGVFKGTRARGTLESPAVPQENDAVVTLLGAIYDGNVTRATAGIELTVDGEVSDGVAPQRIAMLTGETNTRVERVSIYGNGVVNVRSTTNSTSTTTGALTVSGGLGVVGNINSGGNITINSAKIKNELLFENPALKIAKIFSPVDINTWAYSGVSFSVAAQETNPTGIFFKPDGTRLFITGTTGDDVTAYDLSTAWDIATATHIGESVNVGEATPQDLFFKSDGSVLYITGSTNDSIRTFTLATPWDISNITFVNETTLASKGLDEGVPTGLAFSADGDYMYITGTGLDSISQFELSTPWDVTTATLLVTVPYNTIAPGEAFPNPQAVDFNSSGTFYTIVDSTADSVFQFGCTVPWDVTTSFYVGKSYVGFQELTPAAIWFAPSQSKAWIVGQTADTIFEYDTTAAGLYFDSDINYFDSQTEFGAPVYFDKPVNSRATIRNEGTLTQTGTASFSGAVTMSTTTSALNIGTSQTTGAFIIGGTTQTGAITVGRSTGAQTLNIATGATLSGTTKTVNIGTAGVAGSTTNINLGSVAGSGNILLNNDITNGQANGVGNIGTAANTFGTVFAANFNGSGAGLTNLNMANAASGTLAVARGGTGVTTSTGSGNNVLSTSPVLTTPNLGTPSAGTLTSCTGLPIVAGTTGTLTVARGGTGVTTSTGTGAVVLGTSPTFTTQITVPAIVKSGTNGVGNIGAAGSTFNTVFAKATSAQYADVAEQYQADADYPPGTVLIIGGAQEVTASVHGHDTAVAGVVSQRPSYLMNAGLQTANSVPVALLGRVPCQVVGTITRGQLLVTSSTPGTATALDHTKYVPGCVIGKALEDYNSNVAGIIEIAVGIK